MNKIPRKNLQIHLICWSIFIALEITVAGFLSNQLSSFLHYLGFYTLNIGLFYANFAILQKYGKNHQISFKPATVLLVLTELFVYVILVIGLTLLLNTIQNKTKPLTTFDLRFFIGIAWRGLYFILYSSVYYLIMDYIQKKEKAMEKAVEIERLNLQLLRTEKDFLRAQINPHLLFNTLNFIKNANKKNPAVAEDAIFRLSELMDYALQESKNELVDISAEIKQIENMIQLNQLRYEQQLPIAFKKDVTNPEVKILPIILITLVENIFKHGNFLELFSIDLVANTTVFSFKTRNVPSGNAFSKRNETGLSNIKSRLEKAFPGKYRFQYGMQGEHFTVLLEIQQD